jgi:hypothetical protein
MQTKLYNKKFDKIKKIGEGSYGSVYKVLPIGKSITTQLNRGRR